MPGKRTTMRMTLSPFLIHEPFRKINHMTCPLQLIHSALSNSSPVSRLSISLGVAALPCNGWQLCREICILSANSVRLVWSDAVLLYLNFILDKIVEMGATYIGDREDNNHASKRMNACRATAGKQPVIGMRQRGGKVKAEAVEAEYRQAVLNAIGPTVKPWTTIYTDDHRAYNIIKSAPFNLETVRHSAEEYIYGLVHANGIESVWAILKRSITGTWNHVSVKHLQRYVDEASFWLNEGNCEVDTIDRMLAVIERMGGKRVPYRELVS